MILSTQYNLFNQPEPVKEVLASGRDLAINGALRAERSQDNKVPNWSTRAYKLLEQFINERIEFKCEDFRIWISEGERLEEPGNPKAFGGVIVRAKNNGLIKWVRFEAVVSPQSHARPSSVWSKV